MRVGTEHLWDWWFGGRGTKRDRAERVTFTVFMYTTWKGTRYVFQEKYDLEQPQVTQSKKPIYYQRQEYNLPLRTGISIRASQINRDITYDYVVKHPDEFQSRPRVDFGTIIDIREEGLPEGFPEVHLCITQNDEEKAKVKAIVFSADYEYTEDFSEVNVSESAEETEEMTGEATEEDMEEETEQESSEEEEREATPDLVPRRRER